MPQQPRQPGPLLRTTAEYAWRLIALGVVAYFVVQVLTRLSLVVIPFIVSLLVAAFLEPAAGYLRRRGMSRGLSTAVAILGTVLVLGALLTLVIVRAAEQAPKLGNEINNLIPHVKHWLVTGPLHLNPTTVDNLSTRITNNVTKNTSLIASTALSTGKTALDVVAGIILVIFSTVFLVYDGDRIWGFLVKGVPAAARDRVDAGARAAWRTLSFYTRGTLVVATFHGVVMGITLTILGVPLAFPLAVLIALGSFIPLVGAFVTGALAVGVAGLSKGLVDAIIVVAVLLAQNQIEAHALQPFVVGRYVRIHPLAVVLALATGGLLFGIFGAIVAVPVVACINSGVRAARASPPPTGDLPKEGDLPNETDQPREGERIQPGVDDGGGVST